MHAEESLLRGERGVCRPRAEKKNGIGRDSSTGEFLSPSHLTEITGGIRKSDPRDEISVMMEMTY